MRTSSSSIRLALREIFVAFSFVIFARTFWYESGNVNGLSLLHNVRRNFSFQRDGFFHKNSCNAHHTASQARFLDSIDKEAYVERKRYESNMLQSRDLFLRRMQHAGLALTVSPIIPASEVKAFDGGVGGLGKTKPETGVKLFDETSAPIQNDRGIVSSEIKGTDGSPVLVSFQTPWPLLPTSGALETRDIRSTESAFVQVVSLSSVENGRKWKDKKQFQSMLMDSVFGAKGKFGAYGQPFDIQLKRAATSQNSSDTDYFQSSLFSVAFTTLTPAMRESERKALIAAQQVGADTLVLLVVTTTTARYSSNEKTFQNIASSFEAIAAPESSLKKGYSSSK